MVWGIEIGLERRCGFLCLDGFGEGVSCELCEVLMVEVFGDVVL